MSNTRDSFIDEVTEEVRRDRLFGYMRRYGWIGVLAILGLVGGAGYTEWQRARSAAAAQALGDSLYGALEASDAAARAEAIAALAVPGPAGAASRMLQAASLVEAGETEAAAALLDEVAADPAQPRVWRDLATLKRMILLGRDLPAEERLATLAPLTEPGAPFRVLALEQQALAEIDAGDPAAALALLEALAGDQQATLGLRLRAAQLMVALGAGRGEGDDDGGSTDAATGNATDASDADAANDGG